MPPQLSAILKSNSGLSTSVFSCHPLFLRACLTEAYPMQMKVFVFFYSTFSLLNSSKVFCCTDLTAWIWSAFRLRFIGRVGADFIDFDRFFVLNSNLKAICRVSKLFILFFIFIFYFCEFVGIFGDEDWVLGSV